MVILANEGLEWADALVYGRETGVVDTMAYGTGTVAEANGNTLADMDIVYQSSETGEAKFIPRPDATTECALDINVGQQVALGTTITEMAAIATRPDGSQVLFARDTFGGVILDELSSGQSFERYFQIPNTM